MLTSRKRKVVKRKRKHEAMPCIEEKLEEIDETTDATLKSFGELDELAEIETEFVDFVLPWLKLVPKDCTKSSKVCSTENVWDYADYAVFFYFKGRRHSV